MASSRGTESFPVSLRKHLEAAVFVGTEDLLAVDCHKSVSKCRSGSIFVVGVDAEDANPETIEKAVAKGVIGIVTERLLPFAIPQCLVPDARQAYATLTSLLAGNPSQDLLTIGVMGTHGKTTLSLLISAMLKRLGGRVAYRTSLGCSNGERNDLRAPNDPTAAMIASWMSSSVKKNAPAAVLEITDAMLMQRSASAVEFDVLVMPSLRVSQRMSGLEQRGMESAMLRMCQQLKKHGIVIYNADDARLNQWVNRHELPAIGYGLDADANVRGKRLSRERGFQSLMVSAGHSLMPVDSPLLGDHHARHLLGAIATGYAFGLELHEVIQGVERMTKIPGRLQSVCRGQPFGLYIDLADQPDRLAVALHAIASHDPSPILCVAEVPEGSDSATRAAYGKVLERAASKVILTQSRRSREAGQASMWEVLDGCERPAAIDLVPNRAAAIELALRAARPGEQVLLAGWGASKWTSGSERVVKTDLDVAESILLEWSDRFPIESAIASRSS